MYYKHDRLQFLRVAQKKNIVFPWSTFASDPWEKCIFKNAIEENSNKQVALQKNNRPSFPFILAFWVFISFHFGLSGLFFLPFKLLGPFEAPHVAPLFLDHDHCGGTRGWEN